MMIWCMMIIEVDKIEVVIVSSWLRRRLGCSLEGGELMIIIITEHEVGIGSDLCLLDWSRYFLFNFLLWLLGLYNWCFFNSHVLSASDPSFENNHRVGKASRCIPFLDVLILNKPFDLIEA